MEKCPSRNVEESFKKFLNADPEADDFQNLIPVYICGKIFVENRSVVLRKVADRQTDRQTDKRRALHNVVGGRGPCRDRITVTV